MAFKQLAAITTLLLGSPLAYAASPLFSDNFDSYAAVQLNWTPPASSGWTASDGTVDLVGAGGTDLIPGNGRYVDLDGSTTNSGLFSNFVNLVGGTTYTLSFDLAGSHRGSTEIVSVTFGSTTALYSVDSADTFSTFALNFIPVSNGLYGLAYLNVGGDNVGALLDNVSVSAIPEPETYAMLLAGMGLVGFISRRRRKTA
jgi:PEP-CTERM motif